MYYIYSNFTNIITNDSYVIWGGLTLFSISSIRSFLFRLSLYSSSFITLVTVVIFTTTILCMYYSPRL